MQGGVLYVRPRKGHDLVKKNFFKGGWLHSTATVHASIAGHTKKSAQVDGSSPAFSDVIEFILGMLQPHIKSHPVHQHAPSHGKAYSVRKVEGAALIRQPVTSDAVERCWTVCLLPTSCTYYITVSQHTQIYAESIVTGHAKEFGALALTCLGPAQVRMTFRTRRRSTSR